MQHILWHSRTHLHSCVCVCFVLAMAGLAQQQQQRQQQRGALCLLLAFITLFSLHLSTDSVAQTRSLPAAASRSLSYAKKEEICNKNSTHAQASTLSRARSLQLSSSLASAEL